MSTSLNSTAQSRTPESVRRGRKNAKIDHKNKGKEPQRGLGVEQLERIRMQEILKNPIVNMNNGLLASEPNMYNGFSPNGVFGLGSSSISNENNWGFRYQSEFCTPTSSSPKKMRYDDLYHPYGYATRPAQPVGGELVAIHQQVASIGEGGKLIMEYDFFPNEARNDEQQNTSTVVAAKASNFADDEEITTSLGLGLPGQGPGGFDDSLDLSLSLKLSY